MAQENFVSVDFVRKIIHVMQRLAKTLALILAFALVAATSATGASLITGAKVKDSSLTGRDIRNGSLTAADLRKGTITNALNGKDGSNGANGASGAQGGAGRDGAQGPAGATGTNGRDGTNGADGSPGTQGPAGPATQATPHGVTSTRTIDPGDNQLTVFCDTGLPVGGGYDFRTLPNTIKVTAMSVGTVPFTTGVTYVVTNSAAQAVQLNFQAVCV